MSQDRVDRWMDTFMNPTVFTGVKPLLIVAEEIETHEHTGSVVDAVWVHWDNANKSEFSYITKFGVQGKILDGRYYTKEELAPFKGRLALPERENFEKLLRFKEIHDEINAIKASRHALSEVIQKDFEQLDAVVKAGKEVFCFKSADGDWKDPFYRIEIEIPYEVMEQERQDENGDIYCLKHPSGSVKTYFVKQSFYAFIIGSKADITGLQLKDARYKQQLIQLKTQAREVMASVTWLSLSDPKLQTLMHNLEAHPFEHYFKYVQKGKERKFNPPQHLVNALELMVEKHMPKLKTPIGIEYIPLDNLLYLFHDIIPRLEALEVLKSCDIIYEAPGIILGLEGKRKTPPKFLVSLLQVAEVYQQFPVFAVACERYLSEYKS